MYKGAADNSHYLTRTGSHSTKGSRGGRVDLVNQGLEELADEYVTQYRRLVSRRAELIEEQQSIKACLLGRVPYENRIQLQNMLSDIGQILSETEGEIGSYRKMARAAAEQSWAVCFMHVAEQRLPKDMCMAISMEVDAIIGRTKMADVPPPVGKKEHWTAEQRHEKNRRDKERKRRARLRRPRMETDNA